VDKYLELGYTVGVKTVDNVPQAFLFTPNGTSISIYDESLTDSQIAFVMFFADILMDHEVMQVVSIIGSMGLRSSRMACCGGTVSMLGPVVVRHPTWHDTSCRFSGEFIRCNFNIETLQVRIFSACTFVYLGHFLTTREIHTNFQCPRWESQ
jgi:hypothetical protein